MKKKKDGPVLLDKDRHKKPFPRPHWMRHITRRRVKWTVVIVVLLCLLNLDRIIPDVKPLTEKQATTRAALHALEDQMGRFPQVYPAHAELKDGKWYVWLESADPATNITNTGYYRILVMDALTGAITIVDEGAGSLPSRALPPQSAAPAPVTESKTITRQDAADRALLHARQEGGAYFANAKVTDVEFQRNAWTVFIDSGAFFRVVSVNGIDGTITVIEEGENP